MFRIGEFSKLTQVSVRMLRYYDEAEIFVPEYVDPMTGYRMYTTSQIKILKRILFLRDIGFSIAQMKEMINAWEDDTVVEQALVHRMEQIQENIKQEKAMLARIQSALYDMKHQSLESNLQVTIKRIPSYPIISYRSVVENYYCEENLWKAFGEELTREKLSRLFACPGFSIYHEQEVENEVCTETGIDMEVCLILPEEEITKDLTGKLLYSHSKELANAACFFVYGSFENIDGAYQQFAIWLEQHPQYQMLGECRQIVHKGPAECENPKDYVIELQVEININENI